MPELAARVTQDKFGIGQGNCLSACIASVLGIPLDECRELDPKPDDGGWMPTLQEWLGRRGLFYTEYPATGIAVFWIPEALALVGGPSPRLPAPWQHVVVGRVWGWHLWELVHDPHPDRTGIARAETFGFLIPRNPAGIEAFHRDLGPAQLPGMSTMFANNYERRIRRVRELLFPTQSMDRT